MKGRDISSHPLLRQVPGGDPARNPAMKGKGQPFTAQPPVPTNVIPRSDQVIKYNTPVQHNFNDRLSAIAARANVNASENFELNMLKKAHKEYIARSGGDMKPFPFPRDIRVGDTVIPAELVNRIGRWSLKIPPPPPEHLKRPDEVW